MRSVKTLCIVISLYNIINTSYKSVRYSMLRCKFLLVRETHRELTGCVFPLTSIHESTVNIYFLLPYKSIKIVIIEYSSYKYLQMLPIEIFKLLWYSAITIQRKWSVRRTRAICSYVLSENESESGVHLIPSL